jgi:hypothetical protein
MKPAYEWAVEPAGNRTFRDGHHIAAERVWRRPAIGWCAGLMEKIMNKSSKDASRLGHSTFEDRTLDDAELTAVTGGKPGAVSESLSIPYVEVKFEYTERR